MKLPNYINNCSLLYKIDLFFPRPPAVPTQRTQVQLQAGGVGILEHQTNCSLQMSVSRTCDIYIKLVNIGDFRKHIRDLLDNNVTQTHAVSLVHIKEQVFLNKIICR